MYNIRTVKFYLKESEFRIYVYVCEKHAHAYTHLLLIYIVCLYY